MTCIEVLEGFRKLGVRLTWQPEGMGFWPTRLMTPCEHEEFRKLSVELHCEPATPGHTVYVPWGAIHIGREVRDDAVRAWLLGQPSEN